jgi:hypothetical protein
MTIRRILLATTLLLAATQANAGWREDALSDLKAFKKQPSQATPVPSAEPIAAPPVQSTPQAYQPSYELERAREEREHARAEVEKAQRRLLNNLRKRHEDACQRAYDSSVPYDVLERYCQ